MREVMKTIRNDEIIFLLLYILNYNLLIYNLIYFCFLFINLHNNTNISNMSFFHNQLEPNGFIFIPLDTVK